VQRPYPSRRASFSYHPRILLVRCGQQYRTPLFPPHSTHLLQPLGVRLFAPLQKYYGKAADDHIRDWCCKRHNLEILHRRLSTGLLHQAEHQVCLSKVGGIIPLTRRCPYSGSVPRREKSPESKVARFGNNFFSPSIKSNPVMKATIRRFAHTAETDCIPLRSKALSLPMSGANMQGKKQLPPTDV